MTQIQAAVVPDGGVNALGLKRLSGLPRIEDVLVKLDICIATFTFDDTNQYEGVGALGT